MFLASLKMTKITLFDKNQKHLNFLNKENRSQIRYYTSLRYNFINGLSEIDRKNNRTRKLKIRYNFIKMFRFILLYHFNKFLVIFLKFLIITHFTATVSLFYN